MTLETSVVSPWVPILVAALAGCGGAEHAASPSPEPGGAADVPSQPSSAQPSSAQRSSSHAAPGATAAGTCGHQGEPESAKMAGMTAAHNALRCQVERPSGEPMPALSWSAALASEAQAYADRLARSGCKLQHSQTEHGENLFAGTGRYAPADVVARWAAEARCFAYGAFPESCSCTCGHYTQVVWAETKQVGCGMASCDDGTEIWVCNYDPAGNYTAATPF